LEDAASFKLSKPEISMRTKEQCLADLSRYGLGDAQYKAAQAELDVLMAQEYLALLQKTRENFYEVLAEMSSQILRVRDVADKVREIVDRAATDSATTSRLLVRWTKVLAITTGVLAFATLVLVYATFRATR